jgi:thymidylate synthase ThyX
MPPYVAESFDPEEVSVLRRYFTNLDQPVFALVNLPEVVKGALFARYSRSSKSLRRLFLDEFVEDLDVSGDATIDATMGLRRAEELYRRVFLEYGDDSVAQLGGVHLACEQSSNLLTKVLERGRLMSYLEQSTRYLGYDRRLSSGHYRYYRPPEVLDSPHGARYVGGVDRMFETYGDLLRRVESWVATRFPSGPNESEVVHRRAVRAKALDAVRGVLPAASLSNLGMFGTGQAYEHLLLRMRAHPLPEARHYAELMLTELRKVIPSFLERVDRPDRGVEWSAYLAGTRRATERTVRTLWPDAELEAGSGIGAERPSSGAPSATDSKVTLLDFDPEGEDKVLAAACFPVTDLPESELRDRVRRLSHSDRAALLHAYVGERTNRRHRPGRALERTDYRFEIVTDYGAFRDLQRHRLLTIDWQPLGTRLGFDVPEIVQEAGEAADFTASMERSAELHDALLLDFPEQAPYAVALAFHIRFVIQMNAREAMHLIELCSGTQGHPSYRRVAHLLHRAIAEQAGHRAIAAAMHHVDYGAADLERLEAERRSEARRAAQADDRCPIH